MCGRFVLTSPLSVAMAPFKVVGPLPHQGPRYNIAPSQPIPVIRAAAHQPGRVEVAPMRWGMIPHWSKGPDPRYTMINARAETLADRPAYASSFRQRRGLVPADGYYEWQAPPAGRGRKQPYLITRPDGAVMLLAALWDAWRSPEDGVILSVSIITVAAAEAVRAIHDRMPAILSPAAAATWLDPVSPPPALARLLVPDRGALAARPVGLAVNKAGHDAPDCLDSPRALPGIL